MRILHLSPIEGPQEGESLLRDLRKALAGHRVVEDPAGGSMGKG